MTRKQPRRPASEGRVTTAERAIWLAGLGALASSEQQGADLFRRLVERGWRLQAALESSRAAGLRPTQLERVAPRRMEQIFEGSREELADLKRRVDELVRRFLEQNPQTDLRRIQQLLGLNAGELAHLFGVSRQAVSRWLEQGVPPARQPKLVTILDIAENLTRQLRPERLPAVVRKPAAAFEDLSMLEMIAEDRHDELLRRVRESFDWAATA